MKRLPNWLKIVLAAFGVLFVLGAVFGKAPEPKLAAATPPATAPTSATSATPTPTPVAVTYTVGTVTDGANVVVNGSDGTSKTVRVLGVIAPVTSTGCYAAESLAWATSTLYGKTVQLGAETVDGVAVTLAGGQDYAALAIQNGYLKYATSAAAPALAAAETTARQATSGLWAPPCNGAIDVPAPTPTPTPQPPAPETKAAPPKPAPEPTTEEAPAPEQDSAAYYKNCSAAKAAGAAPLHRGEPGYRPALDRDGDGVACER
ncbi:excalibur calcium-binding domain-containing protein [Amycolatopsis sp., V23-08]|uniref:Excalibur calcium-binding domain-containing protein n=1 Tax=Amycolatopsis heterodermiae TaxID=3110235 RepID=A0ABU5RPT4_9PSEU|nr:excalibur calcium-binding domain-containing protein [Amycolatopsis sp., V23-08]MEA5367581.1 excalibur calcium-binding domain-containing protein [Amycolatopsis sp., V23-08]